jgi:hypothetical protein
MRLAFRSCFWLLSILLLSTTAINLCWANYTFTNIADTTSSVAGVTGPLGFQDVNGFGDQPVIGGNSVAFYASYPGGNMILRGSGGPLTVIAKSSSSGVNILAPQIAMSGSTVAFFDNHRVYTSSDGSSFTTIATIGDSTPFGQLKDFDGQISMSGPFVAFTAGVPGTGVPEKRAIFTGNGGPLGYIASEGSATSIGPLQNINSTAISGNKVAFSGQGSAGNVGVFVGSGGGLSTIASDGTNGIFAIDQSVPPSLSGNAAAFVATAFSPFVSTIYVGDGGPLKAVARAGDATPEGGVLGNPGGGPLNPSFTGVSISGNIVAFGATNTTTGAEIYARIGNGPLQKVIKVGDPLFGSFVSALSTARSADFSAPPVFGPFGLDPDGSGNVAFGYTLSNGRSGIAKASLGLPFPGDIDGDGHIATSDIKAMLTALTDRNGFTEATGLTDGQFMSGGDVDGDGKVANSDLQALLNLLKGGGGSVATVPEPVSIMLMALATPLLVARRWTRRITGN